MKYRLLTVLLSLLAGCSSGNLDYIREQDVSSRFKAIGFSVVGSHGYAYGLGGLGTSYGGARVWYEVRTIPDNGITYSGYLQRWGNELHVYGPYARDAVKP